MNGILQKIANAIAGVPTDDDPTYADNVAIALCTYFDDGEDGEGSWSEHTLEQYRRCEAKMALAAYEVMENEIQKLREQLAALRHQVGDSE